MAALAVAGCGDDDDQSSGERPELIVSAAASLTTAFEDYGATFDDAEVRYSFAGSDELAAQIRQGAKPDVYAAANTALPDALFEEGEVEKPVHFAGNELVIAVPAGSKGIASVDDLRGDGRAARDRGQGRARRRVHARGSDSDCPSGQRRAILANVKSEEPDVTGIVGKLTQGAATAAFLYATDVKAAGDQLKAISAAGAARARGDIRRCRGQGHRQRARGGVVHRRPAGGRRPVGPAPRRVPARRRRPR